jgi:hypothetical protein
MEFRIVPAHRVQVHVLFYQPKDDDPFLNRLVAFADPPYSHVEIAFSDKWGEEPWERELWGSSIYQGETVFYKPKSYARDGYFAISIEITVPQMYKLRSFCKQQSDDAVAFSPHAMYAAYFPFFQLVHTPGTFCSKHVTSALQYGDVQQVKDLNPSLMTPSRLYRILTLTAPIVKVVPSKMVADKAKYECVAKMVQRLLL